MIRKINQSFCKKRKFIYNVILIDSFHNFFEEFNLHIKKEKVTEMKRKTAIIKNKENKDRKR